MRCLMLTEVSRLGLHRGYRWLLKTFYTYYARHSRADRRRSGGRGKEGRGVSQVSNCGLDSPSRSLSCDAGQCSLGSLARL
jgi:hypothetical protein